MTNRASDRRSASKPVLFVTGHAPFDRLGAFARLHELEGVEFALFGGPAQHGGVAGERRQVAGNGSVDEHRPTAGDEAPGDSEETLPFPHRHLHQHQLAALAASGRHRAVILSAGGRVALPAAWAGARRAGVPVILWSALWAHPRTAAHAFSYLALRRLYRSAEAVVVYGPHVEAYVRARGARNVHIAPQSVDNEFWSHPLTTPDASPTNPPGGASASTTPSWPATSATPGRPSETAVKFLFAGRPVREKGLGVLIEAWSDSGLHAPSAALVLVGVGFTPPWVPAGGAVGRGAVHGASQRALETAHREIVCLDPLPPVHLRNIYAAADVLVVPSIPTRTFREPWGLVVNEAMNRKLPVIASDAVGAVAGGLVRDGHNSLVVPAGDARALAGAMRRLAADAQLRARLGAAGERDVQAYTHDAWAGGFVRALGSLGLSRGERW
jgi:glycosyltransferase involved in cell wall biosynthesis